VINRTVDGNEIETAVVSQGDSALRAVFKSTLPVRNLGTLNGSFTSEFHTVANRESKTSYAFTNLFKGGAVKATLTGVTAANKGETADFPEGYLTVEADYKQEYVNTNVAVRTNQQKTFVDAVVAIGYDNLSVGGKVTVDVASKQAPTDYNFGAEYIGADYVAAAVTEKKRTVLNLSYFQTLSRTHSVGAVATFGLVKPSRSLQFGTDYQVDPDTIVRGYAKVESGRDTTALATNVEHRLSNVNALLSVSAEFNVAPAAVTPGKLGVAVTLGDF